MTDTTEAPRLQLLDRGTTPDMTANDLIYAKEIADTLHGHYPGHAWAITSSEMTGLITIRDLFYSGLMGYVIRHKDCASISEMKHKAIMGAGEILERYHAARGKFDEVAYSQLKTNFAGRLEYDK